MRIAVISDIHANLAAFEAVIADFGEVDEVWCLGDVIGYGPDPNECVERLRRLPRFVCLPGNHDYAALGLIDVRDFNPVARTAAIWTREQLTDENASYLERLPQTLVRDDFFLVHASPRQPIWEYVLEESQAAENLAFFDTPYCLLGHSHIPLVFRERPNQSRNPMGRFMGKPGIEVSLGDERMIINPGSVGQPRDRDARAAYGLIDLEERTFEFRRVEYDIAATQRKMADAGLPKPLAERLAVGW
ncbi:MAG: metallophosphoesterase family protein [Chloroflexi bacterium]|nr:metallophosphoesterase family protein [Chloroflexota bacterium]